MAEARETLPQQEVLLQQFVAYCNFERRIEKVREGGWVDGGTGGGRGKEG